MLVVLRMKGEWPVQAEALVQLGQHSEDVASAFRFIHHLLTSSQHDISQKRVALSAIAKILKVASENASGIVTSKEVYEAAAEAEIAPLVYAVLAGNNSSLAVYKYNRLGRLSCLGSTLNSCAYPNISSATAQSTGKDQLQSSMMFSDSLGRIEAVECLSLLLQPNAADHAKVVELIGELIIEGDVESSSLVGSFHMLLPLSCLLSVACFSGSCLLMCYRMLSVGSGSTSLKLAIDSAQPACACIDLLSASVHSKCVECID